MPRKHKNKIKYLILASLTLAGTFFAWQIFTPDIDCSYTALDQLNIKYGLVDAQALDPKEKTSHLSSFKRTNTLKASIVNLFKSKQKLILKFKNEENSNELKDVVLLSLKTNEDIGEIAESYTSLDQIKYAESNFSFERAEEEVTSVEKIETKSEANQEVGSEIIVAVVDSGVDPNHPDLQGKIIPGWDFVEDQAEMTDNEGHGTHIAGIIAENSPAEIMSVRFTDGKIGKLNNLVRAIKFAADKGAQIINLSLGIKQRSKLLEEAIDYAEKRDVIIVAAAGNYRTDNEYYPAAFPNTIAVSALDNQGEEKLFVANFGDWINFSAPGQDIYSTAPNDGYAYRTGTSQAAALVTAKIAEGLKLLENSGLKGNIWSYLEEVSSPIEGKYELGRKI